VSYVAVLGGSSGSFPGIADSDLYLPLKNTLVPTRGASTPTFTRATVAWDFDSEGKLNLNIPSGCPRFTGARLVRNRVVGSSEDFTNASWTKSRATVVGNKLLDSVDAGTHRIYQGGGIPTGTWVLYAELKASELTQASLSVTNNVETGFGRFIFDLVNGTVGSNIGAYSGSASMTPLDNGYFGCQVIVTVPSTEDSSALHINTAKSGLVNYIGTGTDGVLIRKAQAELVSGQSDQTASEYVSVGVLSSPFHGAGVDGCKYFATNKNGTPIYSSVLKKYLSEPSRVNNCLWGRLLNTFNNNTLSGARWVVPAGGGASVLTNGDFSSALTGWTSTIGSGGSITESGGVVTFVSDGGTITALTATTPPLTAGKSYSVTVVINSGSGTLKIVNGTKEVAGIGVGTSTFNLASDGTNFVISRTASVACNLLIDSVSVKEAAIQVTTTTGLDNVANSASRLTAAANDATLLQLLTAATGTRTTSAWIKRISGSGTVSLTRNGGTNWTDITSSLVTDTWVPVEVTSDVGANPTVGLKMGTSGDVIDVDCFQDENGSWRTSPILTTTAAVTRNADVLSYASAYDNTVGTSLCSLKSDSLVSTANIYALTGDTNGRMAYLNSGNARTGILAFDGVNTASATGALSINTGVRKRALAWSGANMKCCADTVLGVSSTFDGTLGAGTTLFVGCDAASGSQLSGNISEVHIWTSALTDTQLQQVTT